MARRLEKEEEQKVRGKTTLGPRFSSSIEEAYEIPAIPEVAHRGHTFALDNKVPQD